MISIKNIILLIPFLFSIAFAQQSDEYITVRGDSLSFKTIDGESIREVFGHVILTQGNVKITCNQAVHYLSRNDAELIGNVIATQDSLTITTPRGFYYGNEKKAKSVSGLKLNDKKVILTADSGYYYFNDHKAFFEHNVNLYDTSTTLTSDSLTYFKDKGKAIAVGNVEIVNQDNIIKADSLVHFRDTKITFADKNVQITNKHNHVIIFGGHLEDYPGTKYTLVEKNPLLIQIDTTYIQPVDSIKSLGENNKPYKLDTLVISAMKMESFRDTANIFKAIDSVKIVRGEFASKNDYTTYYREDGKFVTNKLKKNAAQPIIWYSNSQLTGDSITVVLKDNQIKKLNVVENAFLLSQNSMYKNRFDQISGSKVVMVFDSNQIKRTEVYGYMHSIYYLYDGKTKNGLTKSSAQSAKIIFENQKVSAVKLYGSPNSEFYPENKVEGKEESFTLPEYIFYKNRPTRIKLLNEYFNDLFPAINLN